MKLISWNVNGMRACMKKGFMDFFEASECDFFCIQETKMQPEQAVVPTDGYAQFWHSAVRKGYSGTAIFAKKKPLLVSYGMGIDDHDQEGRIITLTYEAFHLICIYSPNSKSELARLPYRMEWEDAFRAYVQKLDAEKPVIICGDLNVAHREIDLKNPKANRKNAGFTDEERSKLTALLQVGFTDSFRYLYPDATDAYSWWSYRFNARANNAGWRIDYFLVSSRLQSSIQGAAIHADILGSDHCPVSLTIDL